MTNYSPWLAAIRLPEIGAATLQSCLEYFSTIDDIFKASPHDLEAAGVLPKHIPTIKNPDWKTAEKDLQWLEKNNCQIIPCIDNRYPTLLRETYAAPIVLFVQGDASLLSQPQLAIVGTRNPSINGLDNAINFSKELANAGLIITSGLAMGIDAASHQGALSATGKTIAVIGTGLKHIYPRSNTKLAAEIRNSGAIVSEFPPDTTPNGRNFPMRNRIISGMSLGVLVVEAAQRSGSLITARIAAEQNREVFAIPGSIHNPLSRGCHHLLRQGAKLIETATDILEELNRFTSPILQKNHNTTLQEAVDLDPKLKRVLRYVGYETTAIDVIIWRSGLTTGEVSTILLSLELGGLVHATPGGYVRAVARR